MLAALTSLSAEGALQQLILISRHGERERLFKHHNLSEAGGPEGGPALTVAGLEHVSRVGAALRARYLAPETCGDRCLTGELGRGRFAPHELHAESSGLARTLGTAEVLLRSLVPPAVRGELPIAVYSRPDPDDYLLRGYAGAKCPELAARVGEFHASESFRAKETETAALRAEVGRALPSDWAGPLVEGGAVRLRDWWNAYDALETAPSPLVPAETLEAAEGLAAWLESRAFGASGGGVLGGGALLAEVLRRAAGGAAPARLHYFSAHYPLMLGLLAGLGVAADAPDAAREGGGAASSGGYDWLGERLLGYASVLAFEIAAPAAGATGDEAAPRLTLHYYAAPRAAAAGAAADAPAWREVRLPACLEGGCALPAALPALSAAALPNASAWCTACGNEQLPVCAAAAAAGRAACAAGAGAASDASSIAPLEVLTLAMSPLLLLALTVVAAWGVYGRCVALRRHAVASGATVPRCAPAGGLQTELREFTDVQISS
eukprot:Transcript_7527.p1 GENE.Transcript_7527~~Transcript_7527.p1  ORF type:complete len:494 (+),score=144.62 Transcript_7527:55-1536(+)